MTTLYLIRNDWHTYEEDDTSAVALFTDRATAERYVTLFGDDDDLAIDEITLDEWTLDSMIAERVRRDDAKAEQQRSDAARKAEREARRVAGTLTHADMIDDLLNYRVPVQSFTYQSLLKHTAETYKILSHPQATPTTPSFVEFVGLRSGRDIPTEG